MQRRPATGPVSDSRSRGGPRGSGRSLRSPGHSTAPCRLWRRCDRFRRAAGVGRIEIHEKAIAHEDPLLGVVEKTVAVEVCDGNGAPPDIIIATSMSAIIGVLHTIRRARGSRPDPIVLRPGRIRQAGDCCVSSREKRAGGTVRRTTSTKCPLIVPPSGTPSLHSIRCVLLIPQA